MSKMVYAALLIPSIVVLIGCNKIIGIGDDGGGGGDSVGGSPASGGEGGEADSTNGCADGTTPCNGLCVDTSVDPANCGGCGMSCSSGEVCAAGACELSCGDGTMACNGLCVDTSVDPANCGGCGSMCGVGGQCVGGMCECLPDYGLCGAQCLGVGTGVVDVSQQAQNCAACGADVGQYGQSFTATTTGYLTQLDVAIDLIYGSVSSAVVSIHAGGVCDGQPCGSAIHAEPFSIDTGTNSFVMSTPILVVAGQEYTWRVESGVYIGARQHFGNPYAGGRALAASYADWVFTTYVWSCP